jgi:UDP-N-acetylmuramoylalanine--D-glutamate ligase
MNLSGHNILIIGLGKTGLSTARFLAGRGANISVTDETPPVEMTDVIKFLEDLPVKVQTAPYDPSSLAEIDMVIPSPGVAPSNIILSEAINKRIPILSEIELAYRFLKTPMIAITGTNGKTTTTTLIGEILAKYGRKVFVGGNIGNPLIGYVDGPQDADWAVVEVSSFQLQWVQQFHPHVAILLNTTCDHVDYHGSFEAYRQAKEKIFKNQTANDLAILNGDESSALLISQKIKVETLFFSSTQPISKGMSIDRDKLIYLSPQQGQEVYPMDIIKIPGKHNVENVMAAIMTCRKCGCPAGEIIRTISQFRGIAHRIEFAGEKNGIVFYDDSKGTNVGAVVRALETFSKPIILLLGGKDKEGDFETLSPLIKRKVKELILFGEARERINALVGGTTKTIKFTTLKEAILAAYQQASPGDVVLLSPGCASFDEFTDYKARGNFFKDTVRHLS